MKNYGINKTTEFTRKQINVIYGKAKSGQLKVEKWFINELYNLADYYGQDNNGSIAHKEKFVLLILKAVFDNDLEDAQKKIDELTENIFKTCTEKVQVTFNRAFI